MPTESLAYTIDPELSPRLKKACHRAMAAYPKLAGARIVFRCANIRISTMQARPRWDFLFRRRTNRHYEVRISRNLRVGEGIEVSRLDPDILLGWVAHELGHIYDYHRRSAFGVVRFIIGYIFSKTYLRKAERRADTFAVERGMGDYILAAKRFILTHKGFDEKYKAKIKRLYLSPEQIVNMIEAQEGPLLAAEVPLPEVS